ncbi:MAG TPA: hypothetical protein VFI34_11390 [Candidatus Limnocylindrales bacterium]|nr:hypothetical protein [Candidatus Limnocylindrales bacterium]
MASSTAELTLLLKAKNLADSAVASVGKAVDAVTTKAGTARRALGEMGSSLSAGIGNLTENLLTGQDFGQAAINLGAFLAGEVVQEFGTGLVAKFAGSAIVQAAGTALAGVGSTIGGLISAAIPIGMAAAPALIIGAIVAAIAVLIANPDIRNKVLGFAGDVIRNIVGGLAGLGGALVGALGAAFDIVVATPFKVIATIAGWFLSLPGQLIGLGASIVSAIVGGLVGLPGKIADVVRQAFLGILPLNIGPFHITASGVSIDLPTIDDPNRVTTFSSPKMVTRGVFAGNHASGGWVGLHGPELSWLGERGPEYVTPNDQLGATAGVRIQGVSERELLDMVERGMYFKLQRAAPTLVKA